MTEENTKMEEKLGENGILEYEAVNLFPPIVVGGAHIDLDPEWVEKVKDWALNNGKESHHGNMLTTFGSEEQPHLVSWMWDGVLEKIAEKESFVNSWVQIYNTAGFHPPHNHAGRMGVNASGCLYLSEGPSTYYMDPLHRQNTASRPKVDIGDIAIWDAELFHFSPPVVGERIVLSFNLQ
jgi:hypothetical protein